MDKFNNELLRDIREKKRIFPIDLANELGIDLGFYRNIEDGQVTPTDDIVSKLCNILNITPTDIYLKKHKRTILLSIFNAKGGVGKTTNTGSIASAFAYGKNKKVLCVDLDAQCNLTTSLGVVINEEKNIFNLFTSKTPFNEKAENYILKTKHKNIDIISGYPDMDIVEQSIKIKSNVEYILYESFIDLVNSNIYDYIIFDNASHSSIPLYNTIYVCDYAIAPLLPGEQFSIDGLNKLFDTVNQCLRNNTIFKDLKILINKYDRRIKNIDNSLKTLKEYYPNCILDTIIRTDIQLGNAQKERLLIHNYNLKSKAVEDFNKLADEIMTFE